MSTFAPASPTPVPPVTVGGAPPEATALHRAADAVRGWSPRAWERIDLAVAVAAFVGLTLPPLLGVPSSEGNPAAVVALGAGSTLPVAVRRRWPIGALAVIVASIVASLLLGVRTTPFVSNAGPGVALGVYTVVAGASRPERGWWAVGLTCLSVSVADLVALELHPEQDYNAVHAIAGLAGWLAGDAARVLRSHRVALASWQRVEEEERARRAVAEERLRLSREVHDVVSHSLSVIAVRSGVGRMVAESRPDEARAALAAIETASRGALDDLRRLLSTVRDSGAAAPTPGELAPAPRVSDIPALVDEMAAAGLDVSLRVEGTPRPLPPMLELSAYRIVQEALTNVVRHAGHVPTRVVVTHGDEGLAVEVVDDGPGARSPVPPAPGVGFGLAGMRERVALFGGSLTAAPRPEGGFRVAAHLPAPAVDPPGSDGSVGSPDAGGAA